MNFVKSDKLLQMEKEYCNALKEHRKVVVNEMCNYLAINDEPLFHRALSELLYVMDTINNRGGL